MHRGLILMLMLAPALGAPCLAATGDEARIQSYGRHLAQECSSCHRSDGADNGIPSINGWDVERFIARLESYQKDERANPVMVSVAKSLDEEQLRALAAYYASLPKPTPRTTKQAPPPQ